MQSLTEDGLTGQHVSYFMQGNVLFSSRSYKVLLECIYKTMHSCDALTTLAENVFL